MFLPRLAVIDSCAKTESEKPFCSKFHFARLPWPVRGESRRLGVGIFCFATYNEFLVEQPLKSALPAGPPALSSLRAEHTLSHVLRACVCVCFGKTRKSSKRRRRRCQSLEQSICSLPEDGDTCGATQIVIERAEGGKGRDRLGEEIVKERRWEGRKEWAGGGGCGSAHYYGISDPRVAVVSSV